MARDPGLEALVREPRKRDEEIHAKVLTALHEGMSADPRFTDIKWRRYDEIQTHAPGQPAPVMR